MPLSESRLRSVLSGETPSFNALHAPEDGHLFVIDRDLTTDEIIQTVQTGADSLPQDALPLPEARLNIPMPEEVSGIATRERAHLLDIRIKADPSDETGRVGAKVVGQFLGNFQRLLDALGQAVEGHPTSRGNVAASIQSKTRFDVVGGYVGSFSMRLETHAEDDLFGDSLVRNSLSSLFDLFDTGSDFEGLKDRLETLKGRVAKNYTDLLSTIETSMPSVSLNWSQPRSIEARHIEISQELARSIIAQINAASDETLDQFEITGKFITGSLRTFRFEILTTDERFDGMIHEDAVEQVKKITLDSMCRALLQPELHVSEATGDERTTYTLLTIERLAAVPEQAQQDG
ncbi:MAG: hypothetical protein IIC84_03125 [Chloroflexi bacterium]|nr:hypothetical protein [Chloroflexota bacterium]